jgi:DNA-binding NarL/FixJ family response regulator
MSRLESESNPPESQQQLAPRHQHQVLQWLAEGIDVREVARRLNRRPQVVQQHVAALLARLGVATPAEALARLGSATASQPGPDAVPDAGSAPAAETAPESAAPAAAV